MGRYCPRGTPLRDRLLSYRAIAPNGCWIFTGGLTRDGYGKFAMHGAWELAHRVAAMVFFGFPLASPLKILHKCDNPPCFNPEHLFYGTQAENIKDSVTKGRWDHKTAGVRGSAHFSAKLTEQQVEKIITAVWTGANQRKLARRYGVSPAVICNIGKGKIWQRITRAVVCEHA